MKGTTRYSWIQWFKLEASLIGGPFIILSLVGCGPSNLTRGEAATLIKESSQFQVPGIEWVYLGTDYRRVDFMNSGNWDVVDGLLAFGYLRRYGDQIVLTEKGETACADTPRNPQFENARSFFVGERELVEITGIADTELMGIELKEAQFTWRWSPTALGSELADSDSDLASKYSSELERAGRAFLRLYDDGWRVEEVQGI